MTKFTKEKVLLLHQYIAEETGGAVGVRDEALLESALESAFATFDGRELYPTKEEKAARLGASLVANHAFLDGNKRIGMYVVLTFLETNGIRLACTDADIVHAGLSLADGSMGYEALLSWIRQRVPPSAV
jgi:death-on-curing protein